MGTCEDIMRKVDELEEADKVNRSELNDLLSRDQLLDAIEPFAKAFFELSIGQYADDIEFQEFLDSNTITPKMTMGDFRKLHDEYVKHRPFLKGR